MKEAISEQAVIAGNQAVKVWYHSTNDTVALEVGQTTINMAASHFFLMHEMMRKAAAKLVMQTTLQSSIDAADHTTQWLEVA